MGNMQSPYAQVTAFYNYWLGFMTVMDFCWVDQYDVMAGPNRKSRRVMEEENKKLRKKALREYNETVRGLAEFVKKRDKRVIDMQRKREGEREKKREEREGKKELERQKAERARMYEEPEWVKVEDFEDEEMEEKVEENGKKKGHGNGNKFYCVACGKKLKGDKQWKNHKQSKKHREKVAELREAFDDEDREYEDEHVDGGKDEEEVAIQDESAFLSADDGADELAEQFESRVGIQEDSEEARSSNEDIPSGNNDVTGFEELHTEMGSDKDEASILEAMISGRRKIVGSKQKPKPTAKKIQVEVDDDEMDFMECNNLKGSRRNRGSRRQSARTPEETAEADAAETNGNADDRNVSEDNSQVEGASSHSLPENGINGEEVDFSEEKHKVPRQPVQKKGAAKQDNNIKSKDAAKGRKKKE